MLLVCVFGTILLLVFDFWIFRNIKTPVFLYGVVWLIVYLSLTFQEDDFVLSNPLLPSFLYAFLLFMFGFRLVNSGKSCNFIANTYQVEWNVSLKKIVFGIEYLFSIVTFVACYRLVSISQFSAWQAVRHGMAEEDVFPAWIGVAVNLVRVIFFISFALYMYSPNFRNRVDVLISTPPLLLTCLFTTRGDWFLIVITLAYIMIYVKNFSNRKILVVGVSSIVVFFFVFWYSSLDKYQFAYVEMSELEKMQMLFSGYFVNPILNFFYWFAENPDYAFGKYTFRFVTALIHPLFPDVEVVPTVLPFQIINGVKSNVYTSLNWCARDFGIWWALIVQFFLGVFYGKLYKRMLTNDSFHLITLITLCMLMYPIVNQFFDDKFFSIVSILLQRFVFLFVLVKTCVVVRKRFV